MTFWDVGYLSARILESPRKVLGYKVCISYPRCGRTKWMLFRRTNALIGDKRKIWRKWMFDRHSNNYCNESVLNQQKMNIFITYSTSASATSVFDVQSLQIELHLRPSYHRELSKSVETASWDLYPLHSVSTSLNWRFGHNALRLRWREKSRHPFSASLAFELLLDCHFTHRESKRRCDVLPVVSSCSRVTWWSFNRVVSSVNCSAEKPLPTQHTGRI